MQVAMVHKSTLTEHFLSQVQCCISSHIGDIGKVMGGEPGKVSTGFFTVMPLIKAEA